MDRTVPSRPDDGTATEWTVFEPAEPADGSPTEYRGLDAHGQSIAGTVPDSVDLADWVRSLYDAGCLTLVVSQGDVEIGGIDRRTNNGERRWWTETEQPMNETGRDTSRSS
jgi:hypothetical protein